MLGILKLVCYDVEFPELARLMALDDMDILCEIHDESSIIVSSR